MVNFSKMNFQFRCLDASFFSSPFFKKGSFSKSHDHPGYYYSVITPFSGYKENFIQANQKKKKNKYKNPSSFGAGESTTHKIFPVFICIWNQMGIGPCQTREAKYGWCWLTHEDVSRSSLELLVSVPLVGALWSHFGASKNNYLQQPANKQQK